MLNGSMLDTPPTHTSQHRSPRPAAGSVAIYRSLSPRTKATSHACRIRLQS